MLYITVTKLASTMEFKVRFGAKTELKIPTSPQNSNPDTRNDSLDSLTFTLRGMFLFGSVDVVKKV